MKLFILLSLISLGFCHPGILDFNSGNGQFNGGNDLLSLCRDHGLPLGINGLIDNPLKTVGSVLGKNGPISPLLGGLLGKTGILKTVGLGGIFGSVTGVLDSLFSELTGVLQGILRNTPIIKGQIPEILDSVVGISKGLLKSPGSLLNEGSIGDLIQSTPLLKNVLENSDVETGDLTNLVIKSVCSLGGQH